ncbi:ABC transporter ATP-binding protein [Paenactinomyces guangxiensis]|uniref:ATP-binding cassette domain-containing protein n=1 Tax=Paenactinomyces guangxiensis TaxID=1490290 RepID=A0A7W1WTD5_9BACL|nr:ABC transporter transmembrane domain-containing protein [Paenactinomyces guangxiensis]MBA4495728.1 ATP-binding cassette domain-containing protein [Paenactinomyces guangxiensis]MBH8592717.1 ATP-binding cassette domain-containing protein [Paenactinomyces guangxiensis]
MAIKRLLRYLKTYKKRFWIAFAALLAATGADVVSPLIVSTFIDYHLVPRNFNRESLLLFGGGYLLLQFISAGLHYYQLLSFQTIAQWVIRQLRMDVFGKVQHLGLSFFDRIPDGSLVSRITNDTEAVKDLYINVLSSFMQNMVLLIGVFIAMFVLDVQLALWCLFLLPVVFTIMQWYRRLSSKIYHISRQKLSQMNAKLNESIQGMNMIQSLRQEERMRQEFGALNHDHYRAAIKNLKLFALMLRPATQLLSVITVVVVLNFFGFQSFTGAVKIGVLYGFLNLLDRIFEPINQMMMRLSQLQQAIVSAERVFELLDRTEYAPQKQGDGNPVITSGRIEFDNVSFSYDGRHDVLKNISFVAEPGQTVALVGHTGSGKSSIINLLMRFYPVERGTIKIDGQPLNSFDDKELRAKIGLVLQDPFLFVGDVKSNIRLHNKSISDEQVKEAAQFVQAAPFIEKLPGGYDEPVGERGATFSSGQRQLISFARTMAMNPKVLVLDEATASVDTETEEAIQSALEKMRKGRTTIAIAHRLSTIQDADLIIVLHRGEIVERGTHQELLAKQGLYHKMYLLQAYGTAS